MTKKEMIENITKIMAKNWFNETITDTAEPIVVLSKEEYEGKEIVVEMSGGHKLRLTVGKFGEMSRVLEEFTRKETAKEILNMIDKIPTKEVNELNHLRLLKINIAKQFGVEVEE